MTTAPWTSIRVGIHRVNDPQIGRQIVTPRGMRRQSHGVGTHAVIRVAQSQNVVIAGVNARHHHGHVVGLRSGIDEVAHFKVARHGGRQPASVFVDLRVEIDGGRVPKTIDLRVQSGVDFGMTMADANGDDAAEEIQVTLSGRVPKPLHGSTMNVQRTRIIMRQTGTQILATNRQNLLVRHA